MKVDDKQGFLSQGGTMCGLIRDKDWSGTSLGAPQGWSQGLKTLVEVILGANQPMFVAWGPDLLMLYNDAYIEIMATRHPAALGVPYLEVRSEIRSSIEPLVRQVLAGAPVYMDDISLMMQRDGRPQETHFSFSYTPVRDGDGAVAGLFCTSVETTGQVISGRRRTFRLALESELRTTSVDGALPLRSLAALQAFLKADAAGMLRVAPDGLVADLRPVANGGLAAGRVLASQMPRAAPLVSDGRGDTAALAAALGLRALVAIPLVHDGQLRDALYVGHTEPHPWTAEDVSLIDYTAHRISDSLERAAALTALRKSEAHLASIFAQTGAGFAETDMDGRFITVNSTYCRLAGRSRRELLSMDKLGITHEEDRPAARDAIANAVATGQPTTVEKRYVHSDGGVVWVANTISPIQATDGGQSLLTVAIDISAQKRVERDLEAAKELAEEANLAKSTFIANMSHELRTPLSAIIGYSEMLQEEVADGAEPAELTADLGKIEGNARHLLGLINDVLDLSKIESGRMDVFAETFEVEPTVRDVAATVDALVRKKGNTLELDLAPDLGTAHTDVTKLRQNLLNLLSNAAKFTEGGIVTLGARREPGPDGDTLVFSVRDTGIGMTEEQLGRLFQRFAQADASTTRRFGGTGLGLSITKAFSAMLGGDVSVASVYGQGTTFTVTLPARLPAPAEAAQAQTAADAAGRDLVLVIDDDPAQQELMSRFLEREGFTARAAPDGPSGLAMARRLLPRAILLDVTMPGMDGWSVLRALKEDAALAEIPVVMVTFINDNGLATALGAADYVTKPVNWDRFRAVMDRLRDAVGDVLVVDDNPDTRRHLRLALERDGWTVAEAANGREALARVAAHLPRAVLLDLEMPVMDGFAFLHAFRDRPGCREVPVVVVTARDLSGDDRRALRDASRIVTKGSVSYSALAKDLHGIVDTDGG